MQVCTSIQTDNHASTPPLSFLQAGCPSCHPTNSVKALKAPVEEFTDYDSVVVFSAVGCVRIEQNFSSFHIDTCLVGRNAISKNANNVVISSLRVVMFSHNIELFLSIPHIWSRDHAHFRFGR